MKNLNELAPTSAGVQEFIEHVKDTPGLLKHLGFRSVKALKKYIDEADYDDFQELKRDSKKFKPNIKEDVEKLGLNKLTIKILNLIHGEKKKYKTRKELEEKISKILKYIGLDPDLAKYYLFTYLLNPRPKGDFENLTQAEFFDPRSAKGRSISNTSAAEFTKATLPFKGSNLTGYWTKDFKGVPVYVVESYGWYPVYLYKSGYWYEVIGRYSSSTGRQMSNANPMMGDTKWERKLDSKVYLVTADEMKELLRNKTHDELINSKKQKFLKKSDELGSQRKQRAKIYGFNREEQPSFIKFKIKNVQEVNGKPTLFIDIIDVLKRIGEKEQPTPENYTKGELHNITKEKVENTVKHKVLLNLKEYLGERPKSWWGTTIEDPSLFDIKFNHLRENN